MPFDEVVNVFYALNATPEMQVVEYNTRIAGTHFGGYFLYYVE
jgi:hypothetical protein